MTSERPAISVRGLVKPFGDVKALDGIDLEAQRGTVLGVLGPNGAGKTTAVRVADDAARRPTPAAPGCSGSTSSTTRPALRSQIGLAGQYAAVDENLTGTENLVMVGRLYGKRRAEAKVAGRRAARALRASATPPTGSSKTYSGGMRRRLDLAAALVADPPVLFLDEPTTGLDPRSRLDLWETIEGLVGGGTTVLLTTQYLDEADRLADRIVVIDPGRVIADGHRRRAQAAGRRPAPRGPRRRRLASRRRRPRRWRRCREEPPAVDGRARQVASPQETRHDHGGGPPARRGRDRGRRRRGPGADARRRLPRPDRPRDRAGRGGAAPSARRWRHEAPRQRHPGHRRAQPDPAAAAARPADRLHDPAGHVRAAVRLRVRRGDRHAGLRLHRLPDPGDHRPEHRLRRVRDGARALRGPQQGPDRPLPLAADLARLGAGGPDARPTWSRTRWRS